MAATPYKQDLPPKGGYAPINYKRIPARSVLNAPIIFGGLFSSMAYGIWSYKRGMRAYHKVVGTVDKHPSDSDLFGSGKWNEFDMIRTDRAYSFTFNIMYVHLNTINIPVLYI